MNLRVAFPLAQPVEKFEPTRILLAPEYIFLETIYSPLVEISRDGQIIPGVASEFVWVSNILQLTIRENLKASDGQLITIDDVVFSLKRALVLSGNTHGNLIDLLCDGNVPSSIDDDVAGIEAVGNVLYLKPRFESPFLLSMLAAIDFAIIPKRAVDRQSLAISDYSITSGPYFVRTDHRDGRMSLALNLAHYHASPSKPLVIDLVPTVDDDPMQSIRMFERGDVDLLTTIDKARSDAVMEFAATCKNADLFKTFRIRIIMARLTEKGSSRLSLDQRSYICSRLANELRPFFSSKTGFESADQLFPEASVAGLSEDEVRRAWSWFPQSSSVALPTDLCISVLRVGDFASIAACVRSGLPKAVVMDAKVHPNLQRDDVDVLSPDLLIAGPDMSFKEDISLLSYAIATRSLGVSGSLGRSWLKTYMQTLSHDERVTKLRKIHFDAIADAQSIPLASAPYVALTRKPWKTCLSKDQANHPLWMTDLVR